MNDIKSFHVEWYVTDTDIRSNVTIHVADGCVVDVQPGLSSDAINLGRVTLIPGLVNAHTHLEFSSIRTPIPTTGKFTDWIRHVVQYRRENQINTHDAIAAGIAESIQAGTTLLGEIATIGWSESDYTNPRFRGIVFQEILGLSAERIAQQTDLARTHVAANDPHEQTYASDSSPRPCGERPGEGSSSFSSPRKNSTASTTIGQLHFGISPHAPYSTHIELVVQAVELAKKAGCLVAMHLAETEAELELLSNASGDFRQLLVDFGIWNDELFRIPCRPLDYLKILAAAPRSLVIHGNYLDDEELEFLAAQPQMTLVYCPRTHHAFGHSRHPWRRLIDLGGQVAIGTDSRASNPDLSLFAELQFLAARHPEMSHSELLRLGSPAGRRALGYEIEGSRRAANFTLIKSSESSTFNPEQELFAASNHVCGTMIDGDWVWLTPELSQLR